MFLPLVHNTFEQMKSYIEKLGFRFSIPDYLFDSVNGNNQILEEYKEIASFIKEYEMGSVEEERKLNFTMEDNDAK